MKILRNKELTGRMGIVFAAGFCGGLLVMSLLGADLVQDTPGPFQISAAEGPVVYIVDTRTGQVWMRSSTTLRYLGTPEDPELEDIDP